jgi:glycosyltransferase involved in cell wall biosynthesis
MIGGPRVSVIVQAYNTGPFVSECLDSVLSQAGAQSIEVIAIDDASTDETAVEMSRYRDARLRVVRHTRNAGAIATANEGYGLARGAFVLRIDSDDRLAPDALARLVEALEADPRVGFAYGDISTIDETGRLTSSGRVVERQGRPALGDEFFPLLLINFVPAPTTLMRREALEPLLPVPASFRFLDWYLTTGIAERWWTHFVAGPVADYRIHGANMHRAMILDRQGEATSQRVLDRLFASEWRAEEKRRWRRRVYAQHYVTYGDKYFGYRMTADARRCYQRAAAFRPALLGHAALVRRWMACLVGQGAYDAAKSAVRASTAGARSRP